MHILHLTPYYAPAYAFGGVTRAVEGLTRALARRGLRITVLTTDALAANRRYNGPADEQRDGVRVVRAANVSPFLRGRLNLSTPRGMRAWAEQLVAEVDVVHCHEFRTVENLLVTPIAVLNGKPLALSPHGTLALETGRSRLKAAWDRLLSPAVAQRFDHVVGLAQNEIASIQALWPRFGRRKVPTQFSVIPNGIDLETYTNLPDAHAFRQHYALAGARVVLFMGRLHVRKGLEVLAQAFKQAGLVNTRLLIVGPDEGLLDRLRPLLDETIILTGYLDGAARLAAYAAADVFVLPAVGEGLSMAALEAMGAGLPVILSPGCNLPEAAEDGAGLIVEPALEPLSNALRQIFADDAARQQMGQRARQLVQRRFTWDTVAAQWAALYRQLQAGR